MVVIDIIQQNFLSGGLNHNIRTIKVIKVIARSKEIFTSLTKGRYAFSSVGLFVCLFTDNVTQKIMNAFG